RTVGLMTLGAIAGAVIYRLAIAGALKWGYNFGFRPTDLKLLTALLVIVILSFPFLRARVKRIKEG
ncbi:MAG: ABC transporter permease, partial [Candidatus Aerophobetes bacterium]|nr:ABC transporter permease [Candidatus Aerophobetes bacterium]